MTVKVIKVIAVERLIGSEVVTEYWSLDGKLLATSSHHHVPCREDNK